jgi:uncharacterized membrane protein (UPF0127 family)
VTIRLVCSLFAVVLLVASCAVQPLPVSAQARLDGHLFRVEVADTPRLLHRGLQQRTQLAADAGMWFVMPPDHELVFWMKDTLIPLDMLFFDASRQLVSVAANAQPCAQMPCPYYRSGAPASFVLELPAGTAARLGVEVGDRIEVIR